MVIILHLKNTFIIYNLLLNLTFYLAFFIRYVWTTAPLAPASYQALLGLADALMYFLRFIKINRKQRQAARLYSMQISEPIAASSVSFPAEGRSCFRRGRTP